MCKYFVKTTDCTTELEKTTRQIPKCIILSILVELSQIFLYGPSQI